MIDLPFIWAGLIAFAVECYQNGLLGPEDTDGLELRFGDGRTFGGRGDRQRRRR